MRELQSCFLASNSAGESRFAVMNEAMNHAVRLDQLCIDTLRTLAIDAVQHANSGHPGTPMGAAPSAYCLWQRFLRYDPNDPEWPNRDRFVLSVGHTSALLYGLLHLCGVKALDEYHAATDRPAVALDDLKSLRQAGSRCTGHPEYGWTAGVETTTGPLGQGAATSVGMAIAQTWLAATYNRPGFELFSHKVYALCGDGDMMEGISGEAASLAGHLKLAGLCWVYDANQISIEGSTAITFTEDVGARFEAYGWRVEHVADANDLDSITRGLQVSVDTVDRPTLVIVHSHIGYGAPHKHDTRRRTASRSAPKSPPGQAVLRLRSGRAVRGARWRAGAFRRAVRRTRDSGPHGMESALCALPRPIPRPRRTDRLHAAPRAA